MLDFNRPLILPVKIRVIRPLFSCIIFGGPIIMHTGVGGNLHFTVMNWGRCVGICWRQTSIPLSEQEFSPWFLEPVLQFDTTECVLTEVRQSGVHLRAPQGPQQWASLDYLVWGACVFVNKCCKGHSNFSRASHSRKWNPVLQSLDFPLPWTARSTSQYWVCQSRAYH